MTGQQGLFDVLRHPLAILVATALISGLLVPRITAIWQEHTRKTEIKAQLIRDGGKAIATILVAAQFSQFGGAYSPFGGAYRNREELDRALRDWETERIVISARIRAYLVDATLAADWDRFGEILTFVYASGPENSQRQEYLRTVQEYLKTSDVDWNALQTGYSETTQFREYNRAWFQLKRALLDHYGELAKRVLNADSR